MLDAWLFLAMLAGILAVWLYFHRRSKSTIRAVAWEVNPGQRRVLTYSFHSGSPIAYLNGEEIPNVRVWTGPDMGPVHAGIQRWAEVLDSAGVPLTLAPVPAGAIPDIIYVRATSVVVGGHSLSGNTQHWITDDDAPKKARIQNAVVVIADPVIAAHETGHALGILGHSGTPGTVMHATRQGPPTINDARLLLSAYESAVAI